MLVYKVKLYSHFVFSGRQCIKDVLVDGQSHLMIFREETELPDAQVGLTLDNSIWTWCNLSLGYFNALVLLLSSLQFACWVDAVILVFSLENEASFQEVYRIYHQLAMHRPVSEIAFIVVGTQGKTLAF